MILYILGLFLVGLLAGGTVRPAQGVHVHRAVAGSVILLLVWKLIDRSGYGARRW